ncbi:MAG: hypothetical protein V2I65_01245 [Paracoccaceae bacterium]|nr:hypothetical protein [Paracoccaceae bacterium]
MQTLAAVATIRISSWVIVVSAARCGQIVERVGRRDTIPPTCVTGAVLAPSLLSFPGARLAASLAFGLEPAGVIRAMAGQAVAPERRAFAMRLFVTIYVDVRTASPPVAGWLLDRTGAPARAMAFGAALFAAMIPATIAFRLLGATPRRPSTGVEVSIVSG